MNAFTTFAKKNPHRIKRRRSWTNSRAKSGGFRTKIKSRYLQWSSAHICYGHFNGKLHWITFRVDTLKHFILFAHEVKQIKTFLAFWSMHVPLAHIGIDKYVYICRERERERVAEIRMERWKEEVEKKKKSRERDMDTHQFLCNLVRTTLKIESIHISVSFFALHLQKRCTHTYFLFPIAVAVVVAVVLLSTMLLFVVKSRWVFSMRRVCR